MDRNKLIRELAEVYEKEYCQEQKVDVQCMESVLAELERLCDAEPVPQEIYFEMLQTFSVDGITAAIDVLRRHFFFVPRHPKTKAGE
jgi:hypothetical protein